MSHELIFKNGIRPVICAYRGLVRPGDKILAGLDREYFWDYDGPIAQYGMADAAEANFGKFLSPDETFKDRVASRPDGERSVLEAFGGAYCIIDLSAVENIVGIRLQQVDNVYLEQLHKQEDSSSWLAAKIPILESLMANPKREVVEGNLYRRSAIRALDRVMERRDIDAFGLVVCRPQGAFDHRNVWPHVFDFQERSDLFGPIFLPLLDRLYRRLSSNDGELFTQVPQVPKFEDATEKAEAYLNQIEGITVEFAPTTDYHYVHNVMHLTKHHGAPPSLLLGTDN